MSVREEPPRWAELILERLLSAEDRPIICGDLREEYAEAVLPRIGQLRSDLWYVRQVASFAPRSAVENWRERRSLLLLSFCTLMCACWLTTMEGLLRHPGYRLRVALDISIASVALSTILVRLFHLSVRGERWLWAASVALIGIGIQAFVRNLRSPHFEGFVLLISLALISQGILMLFSLGKALGSSHPAGNGTGESK